MRSTAGTRATVPATLPRAERSTARSTSAAPRTGVTRPSLRDTPGREKKFGGTSGSRSAVRTGGWAGYKKAREERSEKYKRFEVEKTGHRIFKFAEAEPFAFIYRHWVDKRPYTCISDAEHEILCPLCDAGDRAKPVVFYNVIDLADTTVYVWEMTADPTRKVQKHYDTLADMEPPRTLDDPDFYFAVSKEQKDRGAWEYTVDRIKVRDLEEDWSAEPLGDDEIAEALEKLYDDSIIYVSSRDDLQEAVGKIED